MATIYHVMSQMPALEKEEMYQELEELALELVLSGRMRIDAGERCNYVRYNDISTKHSLVFSGRELNDPLLIEHSEALLMKLHSSKSRVKRILTLLRQEYTLNIPVELQEELKLARIIVQCNEPVVVMLMIAEAVELYITYDYKVGDMMDMVSWQQVGANSGLQGTDGVSCNIYISCGGNPLHIPEDQYKRYFAYDGYPALARMMIIGAQEIGHYADIRRNQHGRLIGRFSANFSLTAPDIKVSKARKTDLKRVDYFKQLLIKNGLSKAMRYEKNIRFFRKHKRRGPLIIYHQFMRRHYVKRLWKICKTHQIDFMNALPKDIFKASQIGHFLSDMHYNLAPNASVYKDENPMVEESIACAEALARIPQQTVKWGHKAVKHISPNLYKIYYHIVIPECIKSYETITKKPFQLHLTPYKKTIIKTIKGLFKRKRSGAYQPLNAYDEIL